LPPGFDAKAYSTRPFQITHWLHDGDKIDLGGRTLQVIGTPGHTPDAIALLDQKNGLLFTGDTFMRGRFICIDPRPISTRTWHRCGNWQGWRRIFNFSCLRIMFPSPILAIFPGGDGDAASPSRE